MFNRKKRIKVKVWEEEVLLDKITAKDYDDIKKKVSDFFKKKVG